ncbi:MAG: helix-turn-helix domain-containing protein [Spirochaetales bacterium]
MKLNNDLSDSAALAELGKRLSGIRIASSLTQADLAERAAIGKRTVERIEAGESVQLISLIRALRALGLLGNLNLLMPQEELQPMQLLEEGGKIRQRASPSRAERKQKGTWTWGDER